MYTYLYNIIIPKLTVSGGPKEESMVVCIYIHIHSEVPATYLWRFGVAHNHHTTLPERPFPCSYACIHVIHLCCSVSSSKLILIIYFYGPARYSNLLQSFCSNYNTFFLKFQISNFCSYSTSDYSKCKLLFCDVMS